MIIHAKDLEPRCGEERHSEMDDLREDLEKKILDACPNRGIEFRGDDFDCLLVPFHDELEENGFEVEMDIFDKVGRISW